MKAGNPPHARITPQPGSAHPPAPPDTSASYSRYPLHLQSVPPIREPESLTHERVVPPFNSLSRPIEITVLSTLYQRDWDPRARTYLRLVEFDHLDDVHDLLLRL